jgi:tetratricopeptide (TPR) repeat protein
MDVGWLTAARTGALFLGILSGGTVAAQTPDAPAASASAVDPGPAPAEPRSGDNGPARAGAKVVGIGAADAKDTGRLPELTNELAYRAAAAVSKRDWESARAAYAEMLVGEPDNALALANLGSVELQLGDLDSAVEHLERAVRQKPALTQTWLALGMAQYEREDHLRALSAISRAVAEKPDDPRARNYLAATAKALGWLGAAESELHRAIDLDPNYAEAHYNLALIYLERRPPAIELARRQYLRAVELGTPRDPLVEKQLNDEPAEETNSGNQDAAPAAAATARKDEAGTKPAAAKPKPSKPANRKSRG